MLKMLNFNAWNISNFKKLYKNINFQKEKESINQIRKRLIQFYLTKFLVSSKLHI